MNILKEDTIDHNYQHRYFKYKHFIVAISSIHHETIYISMYDVNEKSDERLFTIHKPLKLVNYENIRNIDVFYDDYNKGLVVDVANCEYAYTTNFPHVIYELDGNCIEYCIDVNKIYIFYSYTEEYQTGLFVFYLHENRYDVIDDAFWYDKTITSCNIYNNNLLVNSEDKIYNYHNKEEIIDFTKDKFKYRGNDTLIYKDNILVRDHKYIYVYNLETHDRQKSTKVHSYFIYFWDTYDDKLIYIVVTHATVNNKQATIQICSCDL